MLKLMMVCIFIFLTAMALLQLRQQRMNVNFQMSRLHREVDQAQGRLWNQQMELARLTAPPAIRRTVGKVRLEMTPVIAETGMHWLESANVETATTR
jgi:hypothetical protein